MSQINLKKILSGDNMSKLVDIINYNFDQIILNGGGPQGLKGLIGSPGLPGLQGEQGDQGVTGDDGTYVYVESTNVGPTAYPFGASGESFPRKDDIFLQTTPTSIVIWKNIDGSPTNWDKIETVESPAGSLRLVYDSNYSTSTTSGISVANDPSVASKAFFGGPNASDISRGLFSNSNTFVSEYSFLAPTVLTAAGDNTQLRLICSSETMGLTVASVIQNTGGGIVHSIEKDNLGKQWYKIINGDLEGSKNLLVNLNTGNNSQNLLIGTTANNLGVGVFNTASLVARLSVDNSVSIGDNGFVSTSTFSTNGGIVSQGNLAIGSTDSTQATGMFYSSNGKTNLEVKSVSSASNSLASSVLVLGGSDLSNSPVFNYTGDWTLKYDNYTNVNNQNRGSLTLSQSHPTRGNLDFMFFKVFNTGGNYYPTVSIGNTQSYSLFQVGKDLLVSMGDVYNSTVMNSYIGLNLHKKSYSNAWLREANYMASALWTDASSSLNITLVPENATTTYSNATIQNPSLSFFAKTTDYGPAIVLSETNSRSDVNSPTGLYINIAATGLLTDPNGFIGAKKVAQFGPSTLGSAIIRATNGIVYGTTIKPQYTFYNNESIGLALQQVSGTNKLSLVTNYTSALDAYYHNTLSKTIVDIKQGHLIVGSGVNTDDAKIEIGGGRLGNGYSYIDFTSLSTTTDYDARIIKSAGGSFDIVNNDGNGLKLIHDYTLDYYGKVGQIDFNNNGFYPYANGLIDLGNNGHAWSNLYLANGGIYCNLGNSSWRIYSGPSTPNNSVEISSTNTTGNKPVTVAQYDSSQPVNGITLLDSGGNTISNTLITSSRRLSYKEPLAGNTNFVHNKSDAASYEIMSASENYNWVNVAYLPSAVGGCTLTLHAWRVDGSHHTVTIKVTSNGNGNIGYKSAGGGLWKRDNGYYMQYMRPQSTASVLPTQINQAYGTYYTGSMEMSIVQGGGSCLYREIIQKILISTSDASAGDSGNAIRIYCSRPSNESGIFYLDAIMSDSWGYPTDIVDSKIVDGGYKLVTTKSIGSSYTAPTGVVYDRIKAFSGPYGSSMTKRYYHIYYTESYRSWIYSSTPIFDNTYYYFPVDSNGEVIPFW